MKDNIQAILAIILVVALIVGFFMGMVPLEAFLSLVGAATGYFFSEQKQKKTIEDRDKTIKALMSGKIKILNEEEVPRV